MTKREAAAAVVAALNNADHTLIGDPRKKGYRIAFGFAELKEALPFARQLALLGITPHTTIKHDAFGWPVLTSVNVLGKDDQRGLYEGLASQLDTPQAEALGALVLARGSVPDDILERMVMARTRGWKPVKIAQKMNEEGIIAGMGGVRWTPQKVKKALAEYDKQHGPWSGAIDPEA